MEHLGFYVCVNDLEDELIRAVGTAGVEELFDSQGDLGSFRSLQSQPAWRGREPEAQMRRFLGSGSRRKLRYARLLVEEAAGTPCLVRSTRCSPPFDHRTSSPRPSSRKVRSPLMPGPLRGTHMIYRRHVVRPERGAR